MLKGSHLTIFYPDGEKCKQCGAELVKRQIPCPEAKPGCLVYHYTVYCPECAKRSINRIFDPLSLFT